VARLRDIAKRRREGKIREEESRADDRREVRRSKREREGETKCIDPQGLSLLARGL
jgi:hypothetical protein